MLLRCIARGAWRTQRAQQLPRAAGAWRMLSGAEAGGSEESSNEAGKSLAGLKREDSDGVDVPQLTRELSGGVRFFDSREKYLMFVTTTNEKTVIGSDAGAGGRRARGQQGQPPAQPVAWGCA